MTSERWERTKQILEDAVRLAPEKRAAFLDSVCNNDPDLRSEVESLIASLEEAGSGFLGVAAPQVLDITSEISSAASRAGESVGPYKIVEEIGRGGMGIVYKAEDTRLHRFVALKFLPEELSRHPLSLARFRREAQAASALNHPNICTVYDIGQHGNNNYLVMELLEGQTLSARLAKGALPPERVVQYGIEIAEALDAAHRRGVVHRDLKPGNIFVTTRGECKVLDFGLAKVEEGSSPDPRTGAETRPELLTTPGVAMGTVAYMSPEQTRGEELDARTDIFSLGSVLYEMATGRLAFPGKTSGMVFKAILDETPPPPTQVNPLTSARLDEVVSKALEKDRDMRYLSAAELRADLKRLQRDAQSNGQVFQRPEFQSAVATSKQRFWLLVAASVLVVALLGMAARLRYGKPKEMQPVQLTQHALTANPPENPVRNFVLSRDGKRLAYQDKEGIWIEEIDTGESQKVPGTGGFNLCGWYPDGNLLVERDRALWVLVALTGQKRQLVSDTYGGKLSRDASQLMFFRQGKEGHELWTMPSQGGATQLRVALRRNEIIGGAAFSPDGTAVSYIRYDEYNSSIVPTLEVRNFQDSGSRILLSDALLENNIDGANAVEWLSDWRLLFALHKLGDQSDLWSLQVDSHGNVSGDKQRFTSTEGTFAWSASSSSDGKYVAVGLGRLPFSVYVGNLRTSGGPLQNSKPLISDSWKNRARVWSNDGSTLFYHSRRAMGILVKYSMASGSGEPFLSGSLNYGAATLTGDGLWILAVGSDPVTGERHVVRVASSGGPPEPIADLRGFAGVECARSGSRICVIDEVVGKQQVFTRVDPLIGREQELARIDVADEIVEACLSPDGGKVASIELFVDTVRIVDLKTEKVEVVHPDPPRRRLQMCAWSNDGKRLYVSSTPDGIGRLFEMDIQGRNHVLIDNPDGWIGTPVPTPDGKRLAYTVSRNERNVTLLEQF